MNAADIRGREMERLVKDKAFQKRLRKECAPYIITTKKLQGFFDFDELPDLLETCTKLGFLRVYMKRYVDEGHFSRKDLIKARRGLCNCEVCLAKLRKAPLRHRKCSSGRNRKLDFSIFASMPEFHNYVPAVPVQDEEVLAAAKNEYYDQTLSALFTEHRYKDEIMRAAADYRTELAKEQPNHDSDNVEDALPRLEVIDVRAERDITTPSGDEEGDVLGALVTRLSMHLIKIFGPRQAMYWLMEKLYYRGKYTQLLQDIGGYLPEEANRSATRKDFERKIKAIDEEIQRINDPVLTDLIERTIDRRDDV